MKARIVFLLVLGLVFSAHADWKSVKLKDGSYGCQNGDVTLPVLKADGTPNTSSASAATSCGGAQRVWNWLGTAQAQQTGIFRARFPTGINVGSPPPQAPGLSPPWVFNNVGSVPVSGTAFDSQGVLTLQGSGDFHKDTAAYGFVNQALTGNWQLDFNLLTLTGAGQYRDCGPAFVDALASDKKYVYLSPSLATGKAHFGVRDTTGVGVYETQVYSTSNFSTGPMRVTKIGSLWTGYISTDGGMTYELVGSGTWTPTGTFNGGIHVDSGEDLTLATCTGTNWKLTSLSSSTPGTLNFVATGGGSASNSSIAENGGTFAGPCVARSVDTSGAVTVQIQNAGTGSAAAGTDFTNPPYPQTLSWANGEGGTKCGSVAVTNRAGSQVSRTINYTLGGATGGPTLGSQTTHTLTITDVNLVAIKFQPGVYALYGAFCGRPPYDYRGQCQISAILSTIASEICPNANLVGMKMLVMPSFLIPDTALSGNYTGDSNHGFTAVDQIVNALHNCGKYLILQSTQELDGYAGDMRGLWPAFTFSTSDCAAWGYYDCSAGTATPGTYGFYGPGSVAGTTIPNATEAKAERSDWRDLAVAAATAYCNRYDSNPAFYALGMIYWNFSLRLNQPYDGLPYTNAFLSYLASARSACPTTNLLATVDYIDGHYYPALVNTILDALQANHNSMANTDVFVNFMQYGHTVYSGADGSPIVKDYRGVIREMEEVEDPDMCTYQVATPAQIFDSMRNGNGGTVRPRWPTHIVVAMNTACDPIYGWAAWKAFLNGLGGTMIMNGRDSTLRTPAAVKANYCESSQTCQ